MKITRNMKDEFIVFHLQFINSLEGLGMFFSSAALIRRLRKYTATISDSASIVHRLFFPVADSLACMFPSRNYS